MSIESIKRSIREIFGEYEWILSTTIWLGMCYKLICASLFPIWLSFFFVFIMCFSFALPIIGLSADWWEVTVYSFLLLIPFAPIISLALLKISLVSNLFVTMNIKIYLITLALVTAILSFFILLDTSFNYHKEERKESRWWRQHNYYYQEILNGTPIYSSFTSPNVLIIVLGLSSGMYSVLDSVRAVTNKILASARDFASNASNAKAKNYILNLLSNNSLSSHISNITSNVTRFRYFTYFAKIIIWLLFFCAIAYTLLPFLHRIILHCEVYTRAKWMKWFFRWHIISYTLTSVFFISLSYTLLFYCFFNTGIGIWLTSCAFFGSFIAALSYFFIMMLDVSVREENYRPFLLVILFAPIISLTLLRMPWVSNFFVTIKITTYLTSYLITLALVTAVLSSFILLDIWNDSIGTIRKHIQAYKKYDSDTVPFYHLLTLSNGFIIILGLTSCTYCFWRYIKNIVSENFFRLVRIISLPGIGCAIIFILLKMVYIATMTHFYNSNLANQVLGARQEGRRIAAEEAGQERAGRLALQDLVRAAQVPNQLRQEAPAAPVPNPLPAPALPARALLIPAPAPADNLNNPRLPPQDPHPNAHHPNAHLENLGQEPGLAVLD